jgi:hypothetical protein
MRVDHGGGAPGWPHLLRVISPGGGRPTHSPVLAALPGATLLEVGDWGLRRVAYDDLELVRDWRGFLDAPQRWLRYLLEDQPEEPAT